jgi:hypothetical protein
LKRINHSNCAEDGRLARFIWSLTVLFLLLGGFNSRAVDFSPLSIEALCSHADLVLQGKVLSKTCLRDSDGRIYTRIELQVLEIWKGAVSSSPFLIVHGGGVLGEEQAFVSGQVNYELGEEVVAFLVHNKRGEGVTVGLMQGKFHIWSDGETQFAFSPFHGIDEKLAGSKNTLRVQSGTSGTERLLLAELKRRVLEARP